MNLTKPKQKKGSSPNTNPLFPIIKEPNGENKIFRGRFNGFAVIIDDIDEQKALYQMGNFGKGNLSRSSPKFNAGPIIIRKRQYEHQMKLQQFNGSTSSSVYILPDSDVEDYKSDLITPVQCSFPYNIKETLNLSLVEAFFLKAYCNCLQITDVENVLSNEECWKLFCETDELFVQQYPVYHYFRSRKWVVKPGLKFGGDFLLYKDGPAYYHASFLVKIDIVDEDTLARRTDLGRFPEKLATCHGLKRLVENTGKELLICQIVWPKDLTLEQAKEHNCTNKLSIREILVQTWKCDDN